MNDHKKVQELKKGNKTIFKTLYKYYPLIENMILDNNGTREDAKDIFQNTLIVFYKTIQNPHFDLKAKISTYLYSVSQKLWRKKLTRDQSRFHEALKGDEEFYYLHQEDIKLHDPELTPLQDYLMKKLEELGDPCKSLILKHEYEKLSMKIIAAEMGYANENTARQQKHKCILKLRNTIPNHLKDSYLN